jgi:hypothetical protein
MTDQPPTSFWDRLKTVLDARGWDAGDLSYPLARARVNVPRDTIRSWQTTKMPRLDTVYAIADLLEIDARGLAGVNQAEPTVAEIQRLREIAAAEERGDVAAEDG